MAVADKKRDENKAVHLLAGGYVRRSSFVNSLLSTDLDLTFLYCFIIRSSVTLFPIFHMLIKIPVVKDSRALLDSRTG